jgi:hemoglobin-like flavoprotein
MLTEREATLVRSGLRDMLRRIDHHEMDFYEAFFRRVPEARKLFREDLAGQEMKFMTSLKVIVDNLDQPEDLKPRYADLGRSHALLGVKAAYFPAMGEALIETLDLAVGTELDDETKAAWRKLFEQVSTRIIASAGLE